MKPEPDASVFDERGGELGENGRGEDEEEVKSRTMPETPRLLHFRFPLGRRRRGQKTVTQNEIQEHPGKRRKNRRGRSYRFGH